MNFIGVIRSDPPTQRSDEIDVGLSARGANLIPCRINPGLFFGLILDGIEAGEVIPLELLPTIDRECLIKGTIGGSSSFFVFCFFFFDLAAGAATARYSPDSRLIIDNSLFASIEEYAGELQVGLRLINQKHTRLSELAVTIYQHSSDESDVHKG